MKKFTHDRRQTLGVECYDKTKYIEDKKFLIKIWDTAGQEKYAVMAKNYYQRAHGIILTCALDKRSSFFNLKNWLNSLKENTTQDIPVIIIANKKDLEDSREVSEEELKEKADELFVEYYETSAKDNIMIDDAFEKIIEKVFNKIYRAKEKGFGLVNEKNSLKNNVHNKCTSC